MQPLHVHIPWVYHVPPPIILHNAPHVYTALGYTGVNNFMICVHMSITKPQLHKQCVAVSIRSVQKGHILSTFPFRHPLTSIAL